jgi:hypothetical protein
MEAVEHELLKKPNTKTLDRLSMLAGFQDWQSFQDALHGQADARTNYDGKEKLGQNYDGKEKHGQNYDGQA